MKTVSVFVGVLFSAILFCSESLSAQDVVQKQFIRDVDGVYMGSELTQTEIIEHFGVPTDVITSASADGRIELCYYNESYLEFNDGTLIGFCLRDAKMPCLTIHVKGGLRVGDPLSLLDGFTYGNPKPHTNGTYILFSGSDNPVYLLVSNGVITGIDYSEPL